MIELHENEIASHIEARLAIEGLFEADIVRLIQIAKLIVRPRTGGVVTAEDLLQEAIVRTLEGKRQWKKNIPIVQHLIWVMRSYSSHIAGQIKTRGVEYLGGTADQHVAPVPTSEEILASEDEYEYFFGLFSEDWLVQGILTLRSQGCTKSTIVENLSITTTQYETGMKRIRRQLEKFTREIPVINRRQ